MLEHLGCDLVISSASAAGKRRLSQETALSGQALGGVVTAAGGSALIAGLHGAASRVVGGVILLLSILSTVVREVGATDVYVRNRIKRRAYDELWWEVWNYALFDLAHDDPNKADEKLTAFLLRRERIGSDSLPGSGSAGTQPTSVAVSPDESVGGSGDAPSSPGAGGDSEAAPVSRAHTDS